MSANSCMIICLFGIYPGSKFVDFLCEQFQCVDVVYVDEVTALVVFSHNPARILKTYIFPGMLVTDLQRGACCVRGCHSNFRVFSTSIYL